MGLEAGGRGGAEEKEKEEKKEEEKILHMYESIGHRPLWGRCLALPSTLSTTYSGTGTADRLTLLRLFCLEKLVKQRKVWIQQKMKH